MVSFALHALLPFQVALGSVASLTSAAGFEADLDVGAYALPGLHEDETSMIQHQYSVLDHKARKSPSSFDGSFGPDIVSDILDDDPEIGLFRMGQAGADAEGAVPGHLQRMADRERWVGYSHFTNAHPNGTLVDKHLVQDSSVNFFKSAPPHEWVILAVVCFILCLLDGFVLRRTPGTFRWHLAVIFIWLVVAGLYLWGVWARMGRRRGVQWISGYVLEWMLSMDNLFIFHLVFQTYKTPQAQIHKAVFVGIIGAVVMRMVFFLVVSTLLHAVGWFRWPFGAMLVWSGVEAVRGEEEEDGDLKDTRLVRGLKWMFGSAIRDGYDTEGTAIFIWDRKSRRLQLSMLFVVIVIVEFSDIIFALDSVSAKVAQIPNQYIAFSSSVMAMYGLRAMFFIVQDLVEMFDLLKYGLGVILVFIGVELMFGRWIHISSGLECILIVAIFAVCIVASHVKGRFWPEAAEEAEEAQGEKEAEGDGPAQERPSPLAQLSTRPEGGQVEQSGHDEKKMWTVVEGTKSSQDDDEKLVMRVRSRSDSEVKKDKP